MIKKMTDKTKTPKGVLVRYPFKEKCTGVAGFCPDCDSIVSFVSYIQRYICTNPDCCFEADIDRERVCDNQSLEENVKTVKTEKSL